MIIGVGGTNKEGLHVKEASDNLHSWYRTMSMKHQRLLNLVIISFNLYNHYGQGLKVEQIEITTYEALERHRLAGSTAEIIIHGARVLKRSREEIGVTELFNKAVGSNSSMMKETRETLVEAVDKTDRQAILEWKKERARASLTTTPTTRDRHPEKGGIVGEQYHRNEGQEIRGTEEKASDISALKSEQTTIESLVAEKDIAASPAGLEIETIVGVNPSVYNTAAAAAAAASDRKRKESIAIPIATLSPSLIVFWSALWIILMLG